MKPELRPGFISLLKPKGGELRKEQGATRHLLGKEIIPCVQQPCFDPPRPPRHNPVLVER